MVATAKMQVSAYAKMDSMEQTVTFVRDKVDIIIILVRLIHFYLAVLCQLMCNAEGGSCNASGSCVCKDGWSGVNCDVAVCSPECVPGNGQCVAPNNCSCDSGWTGSHCETCIPADGCCKSFSHMTLSNS